MIWEMFVSIRIHCKEQKTHLYFICKKEFNIKNYMSTNYLEGKEEQVLGRVSRNNSQKNIELTNQSSVTTTAATSVLQAHSPAPTPGSCLPCSHHPSKNHLTENMAET